MMKAPPPSLLFFFCTPSSEIAGAGCVFEFLAWRDSLNYGHGDAEWKKYFPHFVQSSWALQAQWKELDLCLISPLFLFSCTWLLDNDEGLALSAAAGRLFRYRRTITHLPFSCVIWIVHFKIDLVRVRGLCLHAKQSVPTCSLITGV